MTSIDPTQSPILRPSAPRARFDELLAKRILVIDGAMGTMIQTQRAHRRGLPGRRASRTPRRPARATTTCSPHPARRHPRRSTRPTWRPARTSSRPTRSARRRVAQADYGLQDAVDEINRAAGASRERPPTLDRADARPPRFVAGAIGPTNKTLSLSGRRRARLPCHHLRRAQATPTRSRRALWSRAASTSCWSRRSSTPSTPRPRSWPSTRSSDYAARLPLMISVTITDASGRTLSGQTVDAFWNSVAHAQPLSVGVNCSLGAKEMRPYVAELSRIAPMLRLQLPQRRPARTPSASTTRPRRRPASCCEEFAESGLVNIVGGCCGTTPDHIRPIADGASRQCRRAAPQLRETIATSAGSRPWPSPRTPTSSWWASAPTSPARRASAS